MQSIPFFASRLGINCLRNGKAVLVGRSPHPRMSSLPNPKPNCLFISPSYATIA